MNQPGEKDLRWSSHKSKEEFEQLEQAMLSAIHQNSSPKPKLHEETEEISHLLLIGQIAYENDELLSICKVYDKLRVLQGWTPIVKARIALGQAFLGNAPHAHMLAVESYEEHPEEVDAYFAMAKVTLLNDSVFQAREWFELYKKGKGIQNIPLAFLQFEKLIEHKIRSLCRAEDSMLKTVALQKFKDIPAYADAEDSIKRIQNHPSCETLRDEIGLSDSFRDFTSNLGYACAGLGLYPFHIMDNQELSQSLLAVGGSFSKWSQSLISHLCLFLDPPSDTLCLTHRTMKEIVLMQPTCRPLRQMFDHESIWAAALPIPISPFVDLDHIVLEKIGLSHPKSIFKAFYFCLYFFLIWEAGSPDPETDPTPEDIARLLSLIERYNYGLLGVHDPFELMLSRIVDLLAMNDSFGGLALYMYPLAEMARKRLSLTNRGVNTSVSDYLSILALKSPEDGWIPFAKASIVLHDGISPDRACATVAALESADWMIQFETQCLTASTFSNSQRVFPSLDLNLEGLYHTHLHYMCADLHGCHETGILHLSRGDDQKYNGNGIDTIGKFHFEDASFLIREPFSWTQSYEDGTSLQFAGVCLPTGFGGFFVDQSHPDKPIGFWYMCLDCQNYADDLFDKFAEALNTDKEMKKTWAIQNPLQFIRGAPSNLENTRYALHNESDLSQWLSTPHVPITYLRTRPSTNQFSGKEDRAADFKTFSKGVFETNQKYNLRRKESVASAARKEKTQLELFRTCHSQLLEAFLTFKNPEHPKFDTIRNWWIHIFRISSPSELERFMEYVEKTLSSMGDNAGGRSWDSDSDSEDDDDELEQPTTVAMWLGIAVIGVTIVSVGAFFVGRVIQSRMKNEN